MFEHNDQDSAVTLSLIDFHSYISTNLLEKFKKKLCSPLSPLIEFSQNFTKIYKLPEPYVYNVAICQELNYLIVGSFSTINFYNLVTHEGLFQIPFDDGIYDLDLERENSGQFNLIVSSRNNELFKFNFTEMIKTKELGEPIWKSEKRFNQIWGLTRFKTEIYVVDHREKMFAFDLKTGKLRHDIQIDLSENLVDLVFTPEEEMIVCGIDQLHILKFNEKSKGWEKIKTLDNKDHIINDCFSVCYEKKTRLIYLTDMYGKLFIFDRQFNLLKEVEGLSYPYGVAINDKNGELFLCNTGACEILVYK
ncbi:predicted protein [Naegleria gruberi]|uniref:Predicted protein n=1 Tax=Naegleria gruberi TaxID=5762 RepID=D2VYV2_NAEGR|nr:uncharacterized protein NAEGRDRAFT_74253 [Naegleria gruberi]EFC37973.1 predicted protein [Naegleria gruberi]|eukprot:XP_002670717.1 predicted protein [Naegleria gruberi strain NEG-M]